MESTKNESFPEPLLTWRFIRVNAVRIVIGAVLVVSAYMVISIHTTYQRELRIARSIKAVSGMAVFRYCGPTWVPQSIQRRLSFCDRIVTVDLDRAFFDLSKMSVTAGMIAELGSLTAVRSLNLRGTQLSDSGLEHLRGMTNLEELSLDQTEVTDSGLKHLSGLTNLKVLGLELTHVSDAGLIHLGGLPRLINLCLTGTQVTDAGMVHLNGLTNLEWLILDGTQVTEECKQMMEKNMKRRTKEPPAP